MPTENTNRLCRGIDDSSNAANPELVSQTSSHVSGCSKSVTTTTNCLTNAGDATRSPPPIQENGSDCMQIVRQSFETQGISQKATSIILQSWRKGTTKQYSSYIKRWTTYCHKKQIDPVSATVPQALDFLVELFESGIGYSGINTARSALSSVLKPVDGMTFGAQESVKRFLKGVYEARPSNPRYTETWDVSKVLNYLKTISITDCSLKDLTLKLVTLMSLVSAQRGQTIHYLSLEDMVVSETSVTFIISRPIKQSKPGSKPTVVKFEAYPDNPNICVVTTLKAYLNRTSSLRGGAQQLFISHYKPFKPVSRDTISRWVKAVMQKSGIDVNLFKPHSTRAAATSKALLKSVPLEHILSVAGWSSSDTFAKFYSKPVINTDSFSNVLLQE